MRSAFSTSLFRQAAPRRSSSFASRRFASTSQTSQGASNSKQVQDALGAAQQLLARAGRVLSPLGERAAGLLGCAYYSVLASRGLIGLYYSHSLHYITRVVFVPAAFPYTSIVCA